MNGMTAPHQDKGPPHGGVTPHTVLPTPTLQDGDKMEAFVNKSGDIAVRNIGDDDEDDSVSEMVLLSAGMSAPMPFECDVSPAAAAAAAAAAVASIERSAEGRDSGDKEVKRGEHVVFGGSPKRSSGGDRPNVFVGRRAAATSLSSTAERREGGGGMFANRGRFRRPHALVGQDMKTEHYESFWSGVRPKSGRSSLYTRAGGGNQGLTGATLRAAMKLKQKANVIHAKSVLSKYIVDPRSARMRLWKNWMFVNIMYTVLVEPWRISFISEAGSLGLTLSAVANISFVVDTGLRFVTAIETESGLLMDRRTIVRRYLSSWFLLDFVTCLPFTTLLRNSVPASLRVLTPMRGARLLTLLKVVKVYAMHYEVSPVAMSIAKTLVTVILAAHLLSCLWFWVSCFDDLKAGTPKPWKQCGTQSSTASQYLSSFYFIIYTMMTVGYGDQHADASSKKGLVLSVVIQLTGATLFGFIIAATRRMVQFIAPIQKATTTNLQKISEYAIDRRLPDGISSRLKRHFRYYYFKSSVFDERAVMQHVPWQLCHEVVTSTHGAALSAAVLLQDQDFSPEVLMRLARAMKPMELDNNEQALRQGDVVLQVFFVVKGRIEAYMHEEKETSEAGASAGRTSFGLGLGQAIYIGVWGPGSLWGLSNVMLGGYCEATFVAASQSDLLWLDQMELVSAMEEYQQLRPALEKSATIGRDALREAVESPTITKEGLQLKQISLTDFKPSDLKQQLKHTDIHNLCMAASGEKMASAAARGGANNMGTGTGGGMASMMHGFRQMAAFRGRGVKGGVKNLVASLKSALGGHSAGRRHMRLVRTWRDGASGFGDVQDWMGRSVLGVMETEETPEELNKRMIVLPDQHPKLRWDAGISIVCVLVAVLTPYRIAFARNDDKGWLAFDAAVDVFFILDILLRFRTAYVGSAANNVIVYITVPGMIIRNYLRGWMVLDIASTLPVYLFGLSDKAFRGLFVLKLLRVGRVPALAEQLHRLREHEAISNGGPRRKGWLRGLPLDLPRWTVDVGQILTVIIYASHIFGCLWWVTSRYDESQAGPWWQTDGLDIEDAKSTYIASLYWAATTITTVGYGDIVPTNDMERAVACLTMVCGTTMFSYVIGSVSTLVMNPTAGNVRRNLEMMNVGNYLEEQKVGAHLGDSVRSHMMFIMGARSAWNEEHILSRLPPNIRERVLMHVHHDAVEVIPILKTRPPAFVTAILRVLRPQQFVQGEVVYKNLQMSQGVYFVTRGIAEAYVNVGIRDSTGRKAETEEKVKGIVSVGKIFGYTRFLAAFLGDDLAMKAFTQLHVYLLSNSSIRHLLHFHPSLAKQLRVGLEEAVFTQASDEITSEKKKHAARNALYGDEKPRTRSSLSAPGAEAPSTGLSSYLRGESPDNSAAPAKSRQSMAKGRPKSRVDSIDKDGEAEGERGTCSTRGEPDVRVTASADLSRLSTASSDESSVTAPGLSGLVLTKLASWGTDSPEWAAARFDVEESEGSSRKSPPSADATPDSTDIPPRGITNSSSKGVPSGGQGQPREQEEIEENEVRRRVSLSKLAPLRHTSTSAVPTTTLAARDTRHIPPSGAGLHGIQNRKKSRAGEEEGEAQR